MDLLLIATPDGSEPGLPLLVEQAYRRGCTVVAVCPARAPRCARPIDGAHGLVVPMATAPLRASTDAETAGRGAPARCGRCSPRCSRCSTVLGLLSRARPTSCRRSPTASTTSPNAAARPSPRTATPPRRSPPNSPSALPLIWTEGAVAGAVGTPLRRRARRARRPPRARRRAARGAAPRTARCSPGAFAAGADPDDFFRDRVEEPQALHARVVLLRDRPAGGLTAAPAARELALSHDTADQRARTGGRQRRWRPLAELIATTDFAAVYLALAAGA